MLRYRKFLSLLLMWMLLIITTTGCWSRHELENMYVILAMGIDTVEDQYEVTVQVADPSQMSRNRSADRTTTTIFSARAHTVLEALRKMTTSSSRKMYGGHILFVIFDEQTAKNGIQGPLDLLLRESEIRPDFILAVARGYKAKDILQIITPSEILPANDLYKSLMVSEKVWAPTASVRMLELLQKLTNEGVDPVLTGVTLTGNTNKGKSTENLKQQKPLGSYKYKGIGVFKGDRLVGWLNDEESIAYNYITNNIYNSVRSIRCPQSDNYFVVETVASKTTLKPSVVNHKPHMELKLYVKSAIAEIACDNMDVTNEKDLETLRLAASNSLTKLLANGIDTVKGKYNADILGFGEEFHRHYPRDWDGWKQDWNDTFKTLTYNIDMDYHIIRFGKFKDPIRVETEKE